MIYYSDGILVIRTMEEADAQIFTDEEAEQGWHSDISKYLTRLRDQAEGKCVSLTAVYEGHPAGYINVYKTGLGGAFSGKGWPEIVDFGVLERFQRNGIGSKLMDIAEQIAGQYADTVWLGVGLHNGYGSAQRMYVKRGYIPDGTGVWYRGRPCEQYETEIENDDSLQLFFSKRLCTARKEDGLKAIVGLRRMTDEEYRRFKEYSVSDYAEDLTRGKGFTREQALEKAEGEFRGMLPDGQDTVNQFLMTVEDKKAGKEVGWIWFSYEEGYDGSPQVFLNDFMIFRPERRKGYAKAALNAMEQMAKADGRTESVLYVWAHNVPGFNLYQKCGYETVAQGDSGTHMKKEL